MFLTGGIWAADAMEMMLLSFVVPILKSEWDLQKPLDGAINSVVFAGMLCGTAFWSILADKIGRKKVVIISNLGCAVFGALSGLAPEIYLMLTSRFLVGFSVGGSGTAYTVEIHKQYIYHMDKCARISIPYFINYSIKNNSYSQNMHLRRYVVQCW